MAQRGRKPIGDTQAIEKLLAELHRQRAAEPTRFTPHEGWARIKLSVDELAERLRGLDGDDERTVGLQLGALVLRFLVECT